MPRGAVANILVTNCRDNICRIWSETLLPDDGLICMQQLDPAAAQDRVATKIHRRFFAFLGHNRFLSSDARFIALPLYNRFFNYLFPFMIDSLTIPSPL